MKNRTILVVMTLATLLLAGLMLILHKSREASPSTQSSTQKTGQLNIAAAASMKFALDEIIAEFTKEHPEIDVKVTYGSSGNFFSQLSNKAPFDLFLSADMEYPRKLVEQKLALGDAIFPYAVGRIVVWARNDSPIDVAGLGIKALLDPSVRKISIANPVHAPYGRAAEAALKSLGIYDQVKGKLVLGENISQATQYVESGAADIGVIALSLAEAPAMKGKGKWWLVPHENYPPLEQGGVILSWARDVLSARAYCDFLLSKRGREILERYGFSIPEKQ